jgi:hypothetical protein
MVRTPENPIPFGILPLLDIFNASMVHAFGGSNTFSSFQVHQQKEKQKGKESYLKSQRTTLMLKIELSLYCITLVLCFVSDVLDSTPILLPFVSYGLLHHDWVVFHLCP